MSLREALRAAVTGRVASCVPQETQHATFTRQRATTSATSAQLRAANPRGAYVLRATDDATGAQLQSCIAARDGALPNAPGATARPFRLSREQADTCHAQPWTDDEASTFARRRAALFGRGLSEVDADDLAERLHLRDVEGDDRRLCLECVHLNGRRCVAWRRAAVGGPVLPTALLALPQRCAAFDAGRAQEDVAAHTPRTQNSLKYASRGAPSQLRKCTSVPVSAAADDPC